MQRAASPAAASALLTAPRKLLSTGMVLLCLVCDFLLLPFSSSSFAGPAKAWDPQGLFVSGAPEQVSPPGSMAAETETLAFYLGINLITYSSRAKISEQTKLSLSPVFTA